MTVEDLIKQLQTYPADTRVCLYDPDTDWLLSIKLSEINEQDTGEFVLGITSTYQDQERRGPPR
jgi:hypothetical protein